MTSHSINHVNPLKSALGGENHIVQNEAIYKALDLFDRMDFSGNPKKFIYGGKISMLGTIELQKTLATLGVPRLRVAWVNQCYLERFFGCLRDMGGSDRHPSALHLLYRLKRVVTNTLLEVCYKVT